MQRPSLPPRAARSRRRFFFPGVPVPTPRIPIGLGSLSVEAEARGRDDRQVAAISGDAARTFCPARRGSPLRATPMSWRAPSVTISVRCSSRAKARSERCPARHHWSAFRPWREVRRNTQHVRRSAANRGVTGLVGGAIGVPRNGTTRAELKALWRPNKQQRTSDKPMIASAISFPAFQSSLFLDLQCAHRLAS